MNSGEQAESCAVRVPCATAGEDLYRFVTMATNTWFKTGFKTKVLNQS